MLRLLLLVPVAVAALWLAEARRARRPSAYADAELLSAVVRHAPRARSRWIWALQLGALALLLLAAARPVAAPPLPTNEAATIIALDASRSMLADDIAPSRLEAARKLAEEFVRQSPRSARLGLISFSDVASLLVPPTTNHAEVLDALAKVQAGQNTSLTSAVVAGVRLLPGRKGLPLPAELQPRAPGAGVPQAPPSTSPAPGAPTAEHPERLAPGAIVVLSDGVGNVSGNADLPADLALTIAARFATDNNVTIDALPFGREGGAVTHLNGQDYFVPYAPQNLERLTEVAGGSLVEPTDARAVRELAHKLGTAMRWVPRQLEVSAPLAAVAVALLLAAGALGMRAHGRLP
ncbi:MAG: VWA domain-containing protein [Deinococcales bacterium]